MFTLVLRNIFRNRRRSLLTLASTTISLALLGFLIAIYYGFFLAPPENPAQASRLITLHRVSLANSLPISHLERVRAIEGVAYASPWTWFQGTWREPRYFFPRFGCDPEVIFSIRPDWRISPEGLESFRRDPAGAAISRGLANRHNFAIGDRITIRGDIYPVDLELTVAAIFEHPQDEEDMQLLLFHQNFMRDLLSAAGAANQRDMVGTISILARSPDEVPRIAREVDAMFGNSPFPTRTQTEQEFVRSFLAFLGDVQLFLTAICAAVTFTILLVCANTVSMSVRERTREMAIFRTLGYTPAEITRMVMAESVLIALIGGVLGIGVAYLLATVVSGAGGGGMQLPGFTLPAAVATFAMAIVIGVVSSAVPAMVAARRNIVESLRFTA